MYEYTSKNNHIKEINRREELRSNIRRKINRKNDPHYIFLQDLKKSFYTFMVFALLTGVFSITSSFITSAKTDSSKEKQKYYTTVEIEKGDTLTSIAKEYMSAEYSDIDEYIDEIKTINKLTDDNIKSGCYLKVSYYK